MAREQSHIAKALGVLGADLNRAGQTAHSKVVERLLQRLETLGDVRKAVEEIYPVSGFDTFALRLLRFDRQMKDSPADQSELTQINFLVEKLEQSLLAADGLPGHAFASHESPSATSSLNQELRKFIDAVNDLKRDAFHDAKFTTMGKVQLEQIVREAANLQGVANAEGNHDVVRFSSALSIFVQYILQHELLEDVRALNLIDTASLTLQTVLETVGAEDFDSLQQTIHLMEDPGGLFE